MNISNDMHQQWSATNWIKSFCALGGLVLPHSRTIKWGEAVTDFETMPTDIKTLSEMSRCMIQLDSEPDRRDQIFAFLSA